MLSTQQHAEAQKRLKRLAEEQQAEKAIKNKTKNIAKLINDKLKALSQGDSKKGCEILAKLNEQFLLKFSSDLEIKQKFLKDEKQKLQNEKEQLNREKLNAFNQKARNNLSIQKSKEAIKSINRDIDESVKKEQEDRKRIEQDLDKSIAQIREKMATFEKESLELQEDNKVLRLKKEQLLKKMSGLQTEFKAKAEEKDQLVKKDKQGLMGNLKEVQNQVNEATELNKKFATLQKQNFDNKLSVYLRTKKFPQVCDSMLRSADVINKCKQQLIKGVEMLQNAKNRTKKCEAQAKVINEASIAKLGVQAQKEQKLKQVKAEKEQIRVRVLQLQNLKKQKQQANNAK